MTNMQRRFSTLLWLDELHAENELREFSISGALLRKGAVHLHLEVPGLAEGRPNLFIGEEPLSWGLVLEKGLNNSQVIGLFAGSIHILVKKKNIPLAYTVSYFG